MVGNQRDFVLVREPPQDVERANFAAGIDWKELSSLDPEHSQSSFPRQMDSDGIAASRDPAASSLTRSFYCPVSVKAPGIVTPAADAEIDTGAGNGITVLVGHENGKSLGQLSSSRGGLIVAARNRNVVCRPTD